MQRVIQKMGKTPVKKINTEKSLILAQYIEPAVFLHTFVKVKAIQHCGKSQN